MAGRTHAAIGDQCFAGARQR